MKQYNWMTFTEMTEKGDAEEGCKQFRRVLSTLSSQELTEILKEASDFLEKQNLESIPSNLNQMKAFSLMMNAMADEWEGRFEAYYHTNPQNSDR